MRARIARLSVHQKLVALALVVSTVALLVALVGVTLFDVVRYRERALDDAATLASVIAENSAAAVMFEDPLAAADIVSSLRIRSEVTRACTYLASGALFVEYERGTERACPATVPEPEGYFELGAVRPILRNGQSWGSVYVERDFSGLAGRIGMAAAVALVMLLVGGFLAFLLAQRLTRGISEPISRLAATARRVEADVEAPVPDIPASEDEVGDLVRAFRSMLGRVRETTAGLRREIDERKKVEAEREELLERERETSRMKDEFVATVSHELRTPLGVILSWVQILEAAQPSEATLTKALSAISRSAGEQARIIEDLVDVSRISAGKMHLSKQPLDLRSTVETSVEVARTSAESKQIRVTLQLPESPCPVHGDPDRLRQMVGNLLSNAVKFTGEGGTVSVVLRNLGSTFEVVVSDDGPGIAPDVLPHVFDRYRQADSSTTRHHGGLGLGLSIVKEVAERHGGSVVAESQGEGNGASFRVRLPRLMGAEARIGEEEDGGAPARARLDGVSVLAVDDNEDALEGLATVLRGLGARVRTAASGPAALESLEVEPAEVVLCDLAMPGMDGFAVLERIRGKEAESGGCTAVVAVSAHATAEHRRQSLDAGFAEHLAKPYKVSELVRAVREATSSGCA